MNMRSIVFALLILSATACSTLRKDPQLDELSNATVLEVDNRGFVDMTVYALRSSQRIRLGTAAGLRKTSFTLPRSLVTGLTSLRFVADPIAGTRASVSEEISVSPGDTVGLMIPPA